jgi:hypothetical protein
MPEITTNLHMHTIHSDGTGTHQDIADAAIKAGLDAVIVTDHNNLVLDEEGYYSTDDEKVLVLIGEEVHDRKRDPQKNHLLIFGVKRELAELAQDPQKLINAVKKSRGLSFLAHPTDPAAPLFNQGDYSWVDWNVRGYTGIEIWNGFSEFKTLLQSKSAAVWFAYLPKRIARGPLQQTLDIWDDLTSNGQKLVAIGGSDAHAMSGKMGPFRRTVFPYLFHFKAVNTHLILPDSLTGEVQKDKKLIYTALQEGHGFVGYDLPYPTRGFRFKATGKNHEVIMGDEINLLDGITLQITLPKPAECVLIRNGTLIKTWQHREACSFSVKETGVYRVEAYLEYKGLRRGWIFSNPIYIR